MKIINASIESETIDSKRIMRNIEQAGRICYKSEHLICDDSSEKFIQAIIRSGHESVIEHEKVTVKVICDRGVSHEIVRHRIASYSQESTRYCNYAKDKFGNELTFIRPCFWEEEKDKEKIALWTQAMQKAEDAYLSLIAQGAKPDEARSVLPNSLKTELFMTMNLREWRHFLKLRTHEHSHPQIREISKMILSLFKEKLPVLFMDL